LETAKISQQEFFGRISVKTTNIRKAGAFLMDKWENNKAWFLVLPAFIIVAFSAVIPLMTVVNYSIQDIFGPGQSVFVGTEWYKEMLGNHRLHDALWRQFLFSGLVLLIEIPLGIMIGLAMPKRGWGVSASLVTSCTVISK
jgi:glycerol transport system permease protein